MFISIIILEIIITSHYHTALLNWGSTINYAIGAVAMGILARLGFSHGINQLEPM